jgi:tripartite-type tricarboxylate transporter receptor subunit TctC
MLRLRLTLFASAIVALCASPASADAVADFYRGKTITCYIGYEAGGGYDLYARTISKHITKHIPGNPAVLPVNKPGASSMVLANFLAKVAPRDGTVIGAVNSALIFDPLFAGPDSKAQFTGPDMTMIGNAVSSASVLVSWKTSGVTSFEDLKHKELLIGATSRTGDTYLLPLAVKKVLGVNLKIITGYPGTREAALALERGEISGRVWDMEGIKSARPQWLTDGSINLLAQLAPQKMPEVPANVPLVKDLVASEEDKRVLDVIFLSTTLARPYIAPPGVPADRIKSLRDAFMATMKDAEFLADMEKGKLSIGATSGEDMEKAVRDAYALPDAIIQKVRRTLAD